ncbi:hypothetical protein [Brucella pseudogrignonensis]|uniref:hypothetical protein n=1 Tax=Brucella pseudogrignonensis TaxID=419475 RepID=UPI0011B0BC09|nr:hypothetical protein [Brucella pseudogrignonensis]MQP42358.1 hypothetical protein [Ochrobactrum sp. MYb237]
MDFVPTLGNEGEISLYISGKLPDGVEEAVKAEHLAITFGPAQWDDETGTLFVGMREFYSLMVWFEDRNGEDVDLKDFAKIFSSPFGPGEDVERMATQLYAELSGKLVDLADARYFHRLDREAHLDFWKTLAENKTIAVPLAEWE